MYRRNAMKKGGNPILKKLSSSSSVDVKSEIGEKAKSLLSENPRQCSVVSLPLTTQKSRDKSSNDKSKTMDKDSVIVSKMEERIKGLPICNARANTEMVSQPLKATDTHRSQSKFKPVDTIIYSQDVPKKGIWCNVNLIFCKKNLGCIVI